MSQENNFVPEQETYKPLTPFQLFVKSNFPFIEATYEALDNYGLYCKIVEYLNDVIANENTVEDNVTALYNAFVSLNTYVSNYFDNLDVQEEINNKLDEMATTGVLQQIINEYFEGVNSAINQINNKVNQITSGAPAGVYATYAALVSADPPHGKIYVVTATGKWYYYSTDNSEWTEGGTYLSSSIGISQIDLLNENNSILENRNTKNYVTANRGGIDSTTGEVVASNNRCYFDVDLDTIDMIEPYLNIDGFSGMEFSVIGLYFDDNYMGTIPATHLISFANGYKFKTLWAANKFRFIFRKTDNTDFTDEEVSNLKMYIFQDILKLNTIDYCNILKNTISEKIELGGYSSSGQKIDSQQYARSYKMKLQRNKKRYITVNMADGYRIHYIVKWNNGKIVERQTTINPVNTLGSYKHVLIDNTSQNFNEISFIFAYTENNQLQSTIPDTYQSDIEIIKTKEFGKYEDTIYDAMGDSITYGFIPRNYTGYPGQLIPYGELVAEKLGMVFENYGISGSSIANLPDRDPMCLRYNDLNDEASIISVMGGTNDIRNGVQVGTIEDNTNETFYGALKIIAQGLYDKYYVNQGTEKGQNKKIFFMTPPKLLRVSSGVIGGTGENYDMSLWCKAIKDVAEMYSFPVLDLQNLSFINPAISQTVQGTIQGYTGTYNPYITDGTHPTQEGQELISNVISGFIESL